MPHLPTVVAIEALAKIAGASCIEANWINFALQDVNVSQVSHRYDADDTFLIGHAESKLAAVMWQAEKMSAFAKATARQSTLSATLRA
jgi:hypothetical protein